MRLRGCGYTSINRNPQNKIQIVEEKYYNGIRGCATVTFFNALQFQRQKVASEKLSEVCVAGGEARAD